MRRFFRFSIRDLLWLTLVVAMGLGWWVDRQRVLTEFRQLSSDLDRAKAWRNRAGALEQALKNENWWVNWDLQSSDVHISTLGPRGMPSSQIILRSYSTDRYAPSSKDN
jgi:hypothetical protein